MALRPIGTFVAGALLASALTFTGMQSWQAGAAPGDTDTTFVPVAPCRLFDTRPGTDNVGIRVAPLGPGDTFPTQVTGSNGECVGIPNDATAVAFNVTTVNPTADSFLTLFPADLLTRPKASNLNWIAEQSPTPNKVDVKLSPDGKIKIYNHAGTVDVIADIVGYYTPASLTELGADMAALASRLAELEVTASETRLDVVDSRLDAQQLAIVAAATRVSDHDDEIAANLDLIANLDDSLDRSNQLRPFVVSATESTEVAIDSSATSVSQLTVDAPRLSSVVLFAFGTALENTAGENVRCTIDRDVAINNDLAHRFEWEAAGATAGSTSGQGDGAAIGGSRAFTGGGTFHFVCWNPDGGESRVTGPQLTALVFPDLLRAPPPPPT